MQRGLIGAIQASGQVLEDELDLGAREAVSPTEKQHDSRKIIESDLLSLARPLNAHLTDEVLKRLGLPHEAVAHDLHVVSVLIWVDQGRHSPIISVRLTQHRATDVRRMIVGPVLIPVEGHLLAAMIDVFELTRRVSMIDTICLADGLDPRPHVDLATASEYV